MVNAFLSKRKSLWILNFAKLEFNFTMRFLRGYVFLLVLRMQVKPALLDFFL